jgi:hypothetical protein
MQTSLEVKLWCTFLLQKLLDRIQLFSATSLESSGIVDYQVRSLRSLNLVPNIVDTSGPFGRWRLQASLIVQLVRMLV